MPRAVAPPPSGEFEVRLIKPFSGPPTHTVEVIGEPNRPASVKIVQFTGNAKSSEKVGDVPSDDVNELLTLVSTLRGFPTNGSRDIFGFDTKLEFNTFEIQYSNSDDADATAAENVQELAAEQKDDFKRIADSIEALGRAFAKKDAAV
nr:hypothetical protein CFP56_70125 [Quercus suber]